MTTTAKASRKTSTLSKPYVATYGGYTFTIPAGWPVSNTTACGPDDSYRFVSNVRKLAADVTGLPDSMLRHDLEHYGLNVPEEYCTPYEA